MKKRSGGTKVNRGKEEILPKYKKLFKYHFEFKTKVENVLQNLNF